MCGALYGWSNLHFPDSDPNYLMVYVWGPLWVVKSSLSSHFRANSSLWLTLSKSSLQNHYFACTKHPGCIKCCCYGNNQYKYPLPNKGNKLTRWYNTEHYEVQVTSDMVLQQWPTMKVNFLPRSRTQLWLHRLSVISTGPQIWLNVASTKVGKISRSDCHTASFISTAASFFQNTLKIYTEPMFWTTMPCMLYDAAQT